jgi:alanine racemase
MFNKKYYVDIGGKHAPVLGRISTYNIIVDLTGINAKIGDEVKFEVNTMLVPEHILREYV